jgi:hypothetical protein
MVATSSLLARLIVVAPLLASTLAAPSSRSALGVGQRTDAEQMVLSDPSPSYFSNDDGTTVDAPTAVRQPDFVESMLIEAKRKGVDVSQWGVTDDQMDDVVRATGVDLDDEAQRLALLAEAAAEQGTAWIQPALTNVHTTIRKTSSSVAAPITPATQPGSGWIWNVCGSRQEAVVLSDINVKPDPPVAGQNLTVYAKGTLNADLDEGSYADVVVKLGFIRLLSRRFDICELARENDAELQCPLKPGQYEITHTVELPREIPPARFNVHVSGKTQADVDLMCMDLSIDFSHR